jgi:hypothetical protein
VTFEDFRQWALDRSRRAALRWEDPHDDEMQILLGQDDYGAHHVVPVPPFFSNQERGHVSWLATSLPDLLANRSLQRIAFRTSAWASRNPKYEDRPVDDPRREERLLLAVAEKGRFEYWFSAITRSRSAVPIAGEWEMYAKDEEVVGGAVPKYIRKAIDTRGGAQAPTMPAADMVLGPWDVPDDLFPLQSSCGPLPNPTETAASSYMAVFRPESPGPMIISQAAVSNSDDAAPDYLVGAMQALRETGNDEFEGPPLGEESHYFRGTLDGGRLQRYTALWRYPHVFCEVAVASPSGRFKASDVRRYAALQDKRARAELNSPSHER